MSTLKAVHFDPELFRIFAFWGCVLALKLFGILLPLARFRFQKKIFANAEDAASVKGKVVLNDPDIERVRRAHLNDLENIPIWYVVTALWLTTGPSVWLAGVLIRTFVIARIVHSFAYVVFHIQPHRALAFFVGLGITIYQTINTLMYYL